MKKAKLFLFTLCLIGALVLLVSCNEENYNEGFSVKTPSRATESPTSSQAEVTVNPTDSTSSSATAIPTITPTMNKEEFGGEVFLPTPPPDTDAEVTGDISNTPVTEAPSVETAVPTQKPTLQPQLTPATKTGILLPPIWFK